MKSKLKDSEKEEATDVEATYLEEQDVVMPHGQRIPVEKLIRRWVEHDWGEASLKLQSQPGHMVR